MKAYAEQGQGRILLPSRRSLLLGGIGLSTVALLGAEGDGCGSSDDDDTQTALRLFALGASAIATGGVGGLALLGIEVGYLALKAYTEREIAKRPPKVDVRYTAQSTQGTGKVYDFRELPTVQDGKALSTLSTDGSGYVITTNPYPEPFTEVQIFDENGNVSNVNESNEKYLAGLPEAWMPGAALYLLGLREVNYTSMKGKTASGQVIPVDLI